MTVVPASSMSDVNAEGRQNEDRPREVRREATVSCGPSWEVTVNQLAEQLRRWADDVEPVTADEARRRSSRAERRTTWLAGAGIAGACALAVATVAVTGAGDAPERSATGDAPAPVTPGEVEVSAHAAGLAPLAVTVGPPQAGAPAEAPAGAPPAWLHTIVRFENTGSSAVHLRRGHHTGKVGEPAARSSSPTRPASG